MQFLKTMFWVVLAVVAVVFSVRNWTPVTINLWSGLQLDTFLPLPVIIAFILGVLPYFLLHRATRWTMGRKLANAEKALADTRAVSTPPPPAAVAAEAAPSPAIAPASAPMAVPPGVA